MKENNKILQLDFHRYMNAKLLQQLMLCASAHYREQYQQT